MGNQFASKVVLPSVLLCGFIHKTPSVHHQKVGLLDWAPGTSTSPVAHQEIIDLIPQSMLALALES